MPYKALVEKTIPVARSQVFAALLDFGGLARLLPDAFDSCRVEGAGPGATRHFRLRGDPQEITERLECAYAETVFSYSVISPNALGLEHYHAVVILTDSPDGGCVVRWGSNWVSTITPDAAMAAQLQTLYLTLIDAIAGG